MYIFTIIIIIFLKTIKSPLYVYALGNRIKPTKGHHYQSNNQFQNNYLGLKSIEVES